MSKKKVPTIKEERVLPTPEFLKKHEVIEKPTKRAGEKILYVTDQLWIDTYFKKNVINHDQYYVAQKLLALYMSAGRNQKLTANLSDKVIGNNLSNSYDSSEVAMMDFIKLSRFIGKRSFSCIQDVVLHNLSAREWAIKNSRNEKASAEILRLGLDDLEDAFKRLHA
jgi:hypothetical protein|tara:strand:+ start:592 stop:1092 length:501 start_codon:yes stop_codon:yes gene_type:complete